MDNFRNGQARRSRYAAEEAIVVVGIVAIVAFLLGFLAAFIFTDDQMYVIRPLLATGSIFIIFSYILKFRIRANLFGEIGFLYMALIAAYTILPAIKFLLMDFNFPLNFDGLNFAVLSPQPEELGIHFWRHALFLSGVGAGYLATRGGPLPSKIFNRKPEPNYGPVITVIIILMGCSVYATTLLSSPVSTYIEHYTRFDHLSWSLRRFVYLCLIFKTGSYFVLLALMFSQYRKYRMLIFIVVPVICLYEVFFSLGSRIVAFTILLAFLGFYHFRVASIDLKKATVVLTLLAIIFSGIGIIRASNYHLETAQTAAGENNIRASEFEAVYCTGFHLYAERVQEALPPRDWQMFFYEIVSLIPFIDHTKYHPQYWYARNYFPEAVVPPATMGVIADSAIWGGEFDLLVRSLINGALFAFLTRWFLRRQNKWWALTIYVYCYATCIMTIKYSVFYLLVPFLQVVLPTLLFTEILCRLQKNISLSRPASTELIV